jgi:outer membrane protein assembly factor BamB
MGIVLLMNRSQRRVVALAGVVLALSAGACAAIGAVGVPAQWTEFRSGPTNNAVVDGTLSTTWKVVSGGPISASPALDGRRLYVGNNRGYLDAIDVDDGHVTWTRHVDNALMSDPLIYHGLVIVGEGDAISTGSAPHRIRVGIGPSALLAFDARTGALRWRTALPGSAMPTPAIIDGTLVEHNGAGWITALDPLTGHVRYTRNLHSIASMTAAVPVAGGRFLTLGVLDNAAFELNVKDGSTVWRTAFSPAGSGQGDCPPVTDGRLMICDYVKPVDGQQYTTIGQPAVERAYALDVRTGARAWNVALQSGILPPRNESAIPLLQGGVVYLGSAIAPYMHALDAATGRVIWQCKTHGPVKGGSVLVDGDLYFGDLRGYLWAVNAKTGRTIGDVRMPSGFNVGSPVAVGRTLIIGSRTGSIYALPLNEIRMHHDR